MKILYVATVRSHIGQFHMPVIRELVKQGHEVSAAFKDNSIDKPGLDLSAIKNIYEIPFERTPLKIKNIKAYFALKKVIDEGNYDIIHCHTPMGAVITRLAARKARKKGSRVFYTAHGFHFYKGASKKNWFLYYNVEKLLSRQTDVLITINQEDYDLAVKKNFRANRIELVSGVGIDLNKYSLVTDGEQKASREELGIDDKCFVMLYAADLSKRKNQAMLFRSLSMIKEEIPNSVVLLPGQPILLDEYQKMCDELGISDFVRFMGYRRDIDKLLAASDCVISSSRQEGLPLNLIEAAARGRYIIATDVRGNADVVKKSEYGRLVQLDDDKEMVEAIRDDYNKHYPVKDMTSKLACYDQKVIVNQIMELYGLNDD